MGSVLTFFALTYAATWACYFGGATAPPDLKGPLLLLGTIAPSLVALSLTARGEGREGVRALAARVLARQVGLRWYAFALAYFPAVKLAVTLLHRLAAGAWPRFGDEPWYLILAAIPLSTPVQAGEEIGWRGYALPRLAARLGLRGGSVLLGLVWAAWHLPLFFIPGIDMYGQSFTVWAPGVVALSVAMAWLYDKTRGSLLLVMLMHSTVNQTVGIVPSAVPGAANPFAASTSLVAWLTLGVLWAGAAYLLAAMPAATPAPGPSSSRPP